MEKLHHPRETHSSFLPSISIRTAPPPPLSFPPGLFHLVFRRVPFAHSVLDPPPALRRPAPPPGPGSSRYLRGFSGKLPLAIDAATHSFGFLLYRSASLFPLSRSRRARGIRKIRAGEGTEGLVGHSGGPQLRPGLYAHHSRWAYPPRRWIISLVARETLGYCCRCCCFYCFGEAPTAGGRTREIVSAR